jgi:MFS family permease
MGTHSAFFGPAKYGLMPEILPYKSLLQGNGWMEAGTFLSVLGGMLMGALLTHWELSPLLLSLSLLSVALLGFCISCFLPVRPRGKTPFRPRFFWLGEVRYLYHLTRQNPQVFRATLGIAWFWLVGSLLMSQLPSFAKEILHVDESVFIALLLCFTLGIGIGSLTCHWIFKGEITLNYTPFILFIMAIPLFDLASFDAPFPMGYRALSPFLGTPGGIRLIADIFSLSALGGLFVVPLYSFLQIRVPSTQLAQVVAFNNILIAGFMVFISCVAFIVRALDMPLSALILFSLGGQLMMGVYSIGILQGEFLPVKLKFLLSSLRNRFKSEGVSFGQDSPRENPDQPSEN